MNEDELALNKELSDLRDMFKKLSNEHENWKVTTNTERSWHDGKADAYRLSSEAIKHILDTYF